MTNILLFGAMGKMGRVVSQCVAQRDDCQIIAGIDKFSDGSAAFPVYPTITDFKDTCDVIIDFSHPSVFDELLGYCVQNEVPAVICTTGLSAEQIAAIHTAAETVPLFYSANMSLGINLLRALAQKAVEVLGGQYDIEIIEKHHNQKVDAPSGTALMLADAINTAAGGQYEYVYDRHSVRKKRDKRELGLHAVRGGTIVGEHEILFAGRDEVITLSHSAASKEVFAVGAVQAARFMQGKGPGLYDMADMI